MSFCIAILGQPDGWHVRDLKRASERESIEVLSFKDLQVETDGQGSIEVHSRTSAVAGIPEVRNHKSNLLTEYDAVLIRTMPTGSLEQIIFRMNVLHAIQRLGVPVFNPPRCLEIAIDKWLTLDLLQAAKVPTPRTICCQTREDAMEAFERLGGDCVVKPIFGAEGRGLMHVTDRELAWRVFSAVEEIDGVVYLQETLEHHGFDLRLLVIGQEILAIRRHAVNDWRTNVSQGGRAEMYQPTKKQKLLAMEVAEIMGGSVLGIDIMPTVDGREVVLEVNAVPGWSGLAGALRINVARKVLDHLQRTCRT